MNTKRLITAAALAVAGAAAFAQDVTPDNLFQPVSEKTRVQVNEELKAARADGTIKAWSPGYIEKTGHHNTRAQVLADLQRAQRSGELAAINRDTPSFFRDNPQYVAALGR